MCIVYGYRCGAFVFVWMSTYIFLTLLVGCSLCLDVWFVWGG